jgi:hypothetical protein
MKTELKTKQEKFAADFLLGKLSEEESIKIEEEFFGKTDRFENILIAENDLIDAYASGSLSPEDLRRFESRLLQTSKQRQRVEFAKTLVKYATSLPAENQSSAHLKTSWLAAFSQLFSIRLMPSVAFAIAAVIFFAGALWLAINSGSPSIPINNELASKQTPATEVETQKQLQVAPIEEQKSEDKVNTNNATSKDKSGVAQQLPKTNRNSTPVKNRMEQLKKSVTIFSTIILPLGSTRGNESASSQAFDILAKADLVNVQLNIEESGYTSYFAVLETVEGRQVWSGKINKPAKGKNEKTVNATIPATLMKKGDYIITLKGLTKDRTYEGIGDYSFTINRR